MLVADLKEKRQKWIESGGRYLERSIPAFFVVNPQIFQSSLLAPKLTFGTPIKAVEEVRALNPRGLAATAPYIQWLLL